jgi:pimeloyl-ACP methyl ester carboxylesterase
MRGQLVDVGDGRRMYLNCAGSGRPTVVLVPGYGSTSAIWGWIAPDVVRDTRVCVFDRAGRGWSDPAPSQQDGIALATDLNALLTSAHETPPYVLAGHSFGGLYVRAFAARYPNQTAGVVLLDATDPRQFTLPAYPRFYEVFRRVSALFPSLARFGVARLAYRHSFDDLPSESAAEEHLFWSTARMARSQRDEWASAPRAMEQAGSLVTLGNRPLMVVTALTDAQEGWAALQDDLPKLSSNSSHWSLPTATHGSLTASKTEAALSSQAIREVVVAVRTSKPLARH